MPNDLHKFIKICHELKKYKITKFSDLKNVDKTNNGTSTIFVFLHTNFIRMKILLLNHYAGNPEMGMEFRPYYFAKKWQNGGHEVLIVGGTYSHLRKQQPAKAGRQQVDGVDYEWVPTIQDRGNGVKRVISMFQFVGKLFFRYKRICKNFIPDVVIASSTYPLDNYIAHRIARHYGAKMVYEIHDLWPLSPMELGGMSKFHPFIVMMQMAENYAYRHCDAVVSMLPKAEQHCKEHGLAEGKFYYVPNGIVEEDWAHPEPLPEEHRQLIEKLRDEGRFLVGFAGAHGIANSLQAAITAASRMKDKKIDLVLVGTGQEKKHLIHFVQENHIPNVHFLPPVSKFAIPNFLKEMDVLYIGLQKQSLFRFGISPNKMFDYMMAEKPVIQAIDAGNNIVREASCGLDVEPDNVGEIASAMEKLSRFPKENLQEMGRNGKRFVLENHTYSVLAKKFINCLENL